MPDVNILIYAQNPGAAQHRAAAEWLSRQFETHETVGLSWMVLWAFVRIASNPRVWKSPVSTEELFDRLEDWLSQPNAVLVQPGPRHKTILTRLVLESGVVGSIISDAVLAAIAIEHAATLASTDRNFGRFSGLRWVNPLDQA